MTPARRTTRRAFSLLELVIVIGIIVLLAGLVLAVGTGLLTQSEERQTRSAMRLMDEAIEEWQLASGRSFTYGKNGVPGPPQFPYASYEFQDTIADNQTIVEVLTKVSGPETARTILSRIDQNLLRSAPPAAPGGPPLRDLVDAWGARMVVVFPGRPWVAAIDGPNTTNKDADGTLRTAQENRLGVCRNGKVLLVSAGPDGQLGDRSGSAAAKKLAADNVYSYELEPESGTP